KIAVESGVGRRNARLAGGRAHVQGARKAFVLDKAEPRAIHQVVDKVIGRTAGSEGHGSAPKIRVVVDVNLERTAGNRLRTGWVGVVILVYYALQDAASGNQLAHDRIRRALVEINPAHVENVVAAEPIGEGARILQEELAARRGAPVCLNHQPFGLRQQGHA